MTLARYVNPKSLMSAAAHRWWVKIIVEKAIATFFPEKIGNAVHAYLTEAVAGKATYRSDLDARILKFRDNLELMRQHGMPSTLAGWRIVEFGTGWHGVDLIGFKLLGASKVTSYDHIAHLSMPAIQEAARAYKRAIDEGVFKDWYLIEGCTELLSHVEKCTSVDQIEAVLEISLVVAPARAWMTSNDIAEVNCLYSESVLQRIPANTLEHLIERAHARACAGAWFFHRTDQKDINSQSRIDDMHHPLQYLIYKEWFFQYFLSCRFNTQNRFRASHFMELFRRHQAEVVYHEAYVEDDNIRWAKTTRLAPEFQSLTPTDIATTASRFIGRIVK